MAASPVFVAFPLAALVTFQNADSTNAKTLFTTPTGGCRIDKFMLTSDDTTSRTLTIYLSDGTNTIVFDQVVLRPSTSTRPIASWNVLDPNRLTWLTYTDPELTLPAGYTLSAALTSAVTAGKKIGVLLAGGTF
jgi:hypothetical protein